MKLDRMILADETRPGKLPSGVLIVSALKKLGYPLRIFVGGVDEVVLASLRMLCGQPVTILDPVLCEREETLRWLFERAASPDALNVVVTNLGSRWSHDASFRVTKECLLLAKHLACEVVPIVYSDASSTITIRTIREARKQIGDEIGGSPRMHSVIFKSVLNEREFQLTDKELGRTTNSATIGSLDPSMELDEPIVVDLTSTEKARVALREIDERSAELASTATSLYWPFFAAMASFEEWAHQSPVVSQIEGAGKVNIAVIRDDALALGGDGTEHLIRTLGANIVDVPLEGDIKHNVPIHGVYIPHGLSYLALTKLHSNLYVKTLISRMSDGSSFLLAEGGSAALLGDRITLPRGAMGGADGRGLGVLPFSTDFASMSFSSPIKCAAQSNYPNPLVHGSQEWVWGYASKSVTMTADRYFCLKFMTALNLREFCTDGMSNARVLATTMRIEPWSAPEYFKRWLQGEEHYYA